MDPSLAYHALQLSMKVMSGSDSEGNNRLLVVIGAAVTALLFLLVIPFVILLSGVSALGIGQETLDDEISWSSTGIFVGSEFVLPAPGYTRISDVFRARKNPITGKQEIHGGIDFAAPAGSTIIAAAAGTVTKSGYHSSYGNFVIIDHGGGIATLYAHMSARCVKAGQTVPQAYTIGYVGSTGDSTGNHLHFEVRENGIRVDPETYLEKKG